MESESGTEDAIVLEAAGATDIGNRRHNEDVVLVRDEFPANVRPWLPLRRQGVEVRFVAQSQGRVSLDALAAAVDSRTRVVSVSFVQFLSGFRIDVAAVADISHRRDALFVLDAIQGLGVMPLDAEGDGVDFLAADAHKWLLGPEGAGLGWASKRALERIQPALEGWYSVEKPFNFFDLDQPLKATSARYEEGAYNLAGIHGMVGSLELLLSYGVAAIQARILELTDHLAQGLTAAGWEVASPRETEAEKSGIVLARKDGIDLRDLEKRLGEQGVAVSLRGGALRVSPHAYNTVEELERLLELLP